MFTGLIRKWECDVYLGYWPPLYYGYVLQIIIFYDKKRFWSNRGSNSGSSPCKGDVLNHWTIGPETHWKWLNPNIVILNVNNFFRIIHKSGASVIKLIFLRPVRLLYVESVYFFQVMPAIQRTDLFYSVDDTVWKCRCRTGHVLQYVSSQKYTDFGDISCSMANFSHITDKDGHYVWLFSLE